MTHYADPGNPEHVELLSAALSEAAELIVRVPWDTHADRDDLHQQARSFNQANGRPMRQIVHGAHEYREVTPPGCPYVVVEMHGAFLDFVFPGDMDLDMLLAFAEAVGPFAWPERPSLHLTPKGAAA